MSEYVACVRKIAADTGDSGYDAELLKWEKRFYEICYVGYSRQYEEF